MGSDTMRDQSADPFVYPNIHVNYFNVSFDLDVLVAGLKLTRKIFKTEPLRCVYLSIPTPISTSYNPVFPPHSHNPIP
jgi:hypothetical protein